MGRLGLPFALLLALLIGPACAPAAAAWQPVEPPVGAPGHGSAARRVDVVGWQQLAPPTDGAPAAGSAPASVSAPAPGASPLFGSAPASSNAPVAAGSSGVVPAGAPAATQGGAAAPAAGQAQDAAPDAVDDPDDELVDEGSDGVADARPAAPQPKPPPVIKLTDKEIAERLRADPGSLGPMSIGSTNAGALMNGVQMPKGEHWEVVDPARAWGTRETIDFLTRGIEKVHEQFPGAPPLFIGHISAKGGRHLSPHVSHQAGRDVDISYFLLTSQRGFIKARADNLDLAKTWAFVRALITETDVEMILIDTSIQKLLEEYASSHGEDEGWIDQIFQVRGKNRAAVVRHAKGHVNHLHIRFYSPLAQEMGRRAYPFLARLPALRALGSAPTESFILYKARKGDTLGSLARRYGTTTAAIQKANNLRSNAITAQHVYRIPKKGQARSPAPPPGPVVVPARRLPPTRTAVSAR